MPTITTGLYKEMLDYMREQSAIDTRAKEIMERYDAKLAQQHSKLKVVRDLATNQL